MTNRMSIDSRSRRRRAGRGFTLIELLVTFAIVAILLGLAAPSFVSFQRNSELTSTANDFVGALAAARSEALKHQVNTFVVPKDGTNWSSGWIVFVDINRNNTFQDGTDLRIVQTDAIPSTVTASGGFSNADGLYVEFNGAGFMTTTANAIATSGSIDFTSTATREVRRVIANPAGRLRVCKPSDAGCTSNAL